MRHRKHNHQLGVKSAHRVSLVANLCCSLIEHGRIKTTLAKARALRPAVEKLITLSKKAHASEDAAQKVHFRRLAIARIRNKKAVSKLFDELVEQFVARNGGYTRIYKLALPRLGDAADMALIEFVEEATKKKTKKKSAGKKTAKEPVAEDSAEGDSENKEQVAAKPENSKADSTESSEAVLESSESEEETQSSTDEMEPSGDDPIEDSVDTSDKSSAQESTEEK